MLPLRSSSPERHHLQLFRLRTLGGAVRRERGVPAICVRSDAVERPGVEVRVEEGSGPLWFQPGRAHFEEQFVRGNLGGRVLQKAARSHVPARGRYRRVAEGGERNEEKSMKMNRFFKIVFSFFFILIKFEAFLTYF